MTHVSTDLEIKSMSEKGEISGYASIFNVLDGNGDVVLPGAFAKSTKNFRLGKKPKLLWQHDAGNPIGVIEDIHEDANGLFIKSRLLLDIPKAKEVYELLKNKAIDGFSIGYRVTDSYHNNNIQYLTDIELLEISVVTFPACSNATVDSVKSNTLCVNLIRVISNKIKTYMEKNT
jgi:HK97 family phage prohead protease